MALTNTYRNKIVNSLIGRDNSLYNGSIYIGLSFDAPNADGTGVNEPPATVSGEQTGYGRTLIGTYGQNTSCLFPSAVDGESKNDKYIYFPEARRAWTNGSPKTGDTQPNKLKYFVLFANSTSTQSKDVLAYAPLTNAQGEPAPIEVTAANTVVLFRPEDLTIKYVDAVTSAD